MKSQYIAIWIYIFEYRDFKSFNPEIMLFTQGSTQKEIIMEIFFYEVKNNRISHRE
jgi:hypothetical protein